jgi:CheY-like chemotaxis protein
VTDDGPGVAPEHVDHLFVPFFTTKAPGEGTGLGLPVSFGIAAAHAGRLYYEPAPGGSGARFVLELPVGDGPAGSLSPADVQPAGQDSGAGTEPPDGGAPGVAPAAPAPGASAATIAPPSAIAGVTVLVLDDEPSIRRLIEKTLTVAGAVPVPVADGQSAIDAVQANEFDLVLCDHRMAGMSGTEVFEAIVAIRPELRDRFVFMSGDVLNAELAAFALDNATPLLEKPFTLERLVEIVGEVARPDQPRGYV